MDGSIRSLADLPPRSTRWGDPVFKGDAQARPPPLWPPSGVAGVESRAGAKRGEVTISYHYQQLTI